MQEVYIMTYEELCKKILTLCDILFDIVIHDEEADSITLGGEMNESYRLKVTIEKEDI